MLGGGVTFLLPPRKRHDVGGGGEQTDRGDAKGGVVRRAPQQRRRMPQRSHRARSSRSARCACGQRQANAHVCWTHDIPPPHSTFLFTSAEGGDEKSQVCVLGGAGAPERAQRGE